MKEKINNHNDTSKLLLSAYIKVLRLNLTDETFDEVKVISSDLDINSGYSTNIYEWMSGFAVSGGVHPDDIKKFLDFCNIERLRQEFSSGKETVSLRYRRRVNDSFHYVKMTLRRSDSYKDGDQVVLLTIEDINDDVLASSELSLQKNMTASLVDMYFTCLLVDMRDNTYRRVYVADEYEKYVPEKGNMHDIVDVYTNKLIIPSDLDDFAEKFSIEAIRQKLKNEHSYDYEYWANTEKGKIWCRITAISVEKDKDDMPTRIIIAMQDITSQADSIARTNSMLKDAFSAAVAANSAKSEFMSRMSHDIRTPLNGIIGMTAIAGAHINDKERVSDCLTKITGASKHLLSLINDILDLSKIESGKVTLTDATFNLRDLIDDLLNMINTSITEHHHELNVYVNNVTHENVIGDDLRLQQVLMNLVSNAIKYTPDYGKISITLNELPSKSANIGMYQFIVQDNGYGMSKEFVSKVFEPFERASDSRVSKTQGTGLGMTIARNIINMMGGDIQVESELNKGSKFTVDFKIKLQNPTEISSDELLDLPVLVVDDDISICESTCLTLQELGMKGEYTLTGFEAVRKVVQAHDLNSDYFACLIDWKMPEMDGIETTRRIRKAVGPDVPIIIITAYEWNDIEEEAREAGADAFIAKPLFKSRLHAAFTQLPKTLKHNQSEHELDDFSNIDYSSKRFLLVEDNELNREIATDILSLTKASVETAENGQVAVEMFSKSKPNYYDMIFMDVSMPIMDGYEATSLIRAMDREDAKKIPIIALTANAFVEDISKAHNAGMDRHIAKPIDTKQLISTMKIFLK